MEPNSQQPDMPQNNQPNQLFTPKVTIPQAQQSQQIPTNGNNPAQVNTAPADIQQPSKKKPKFLLVIAIGAAVLLLPLAIPAVLFLQQKKTPPTTSTTTTTEHSSGPQAADALSVEQANNSINQDISSLNDDNDLPPTQLDDKSLGL